jgi:hypothetical protein
MFAQSNIALSSELLYLSQTRYVDGLVKNKTTASNVNISSISKVASGNVPAPGTQQFNFNESVENLNVLRNTISSAKTGIKELEITYDKATQAIRSYINSEDGSIQHNEAIKNIEDTKSSMNEILTELSGISELEELSSTDKMIHSIVTKAVSDAEQTFSTIDLEDKSETLKLFYRFHNDRNSLKDKIEQLEVIDKSLYQSGAGIYQMENSQLNSIPYKNENTGILNNEFIKNNKNNTALMLNMLNVNNGTSGRLFNYYL